MLLSVVKHETMFGRGGGLAVDSGVGARVNLDGRDCAFVIVIIE
jgi:hypothetical protein